MNARKLNCYARQLTHYEDEYKRIEHYSYDEKLYSKVGKLCEELNPCYYETSSDYYYLGVQLADKAFQLLLKVSHKRK